MSGGQGSEARGRELSSRNPQIQNASALDGLLLTPFQAMAPSQTPVAACTMSVSLNTTQCDAVHTRRLVTFFEKLRKQAFQSGGSPGFLDTAESESLRSTEPSPFTLSSPDLTSHAHQGSSCGRIPLAPTAHHPSCQQQRHPPLLFVAADASLKSTRPQHTLTLTVQYRRFPQY